MTDIRTTTPVEAPLLFKQSQKRMGGSLGVSLLFHALFVGMILYLASHPGAQTAARSLVPDVLNKDIVWLTEPGPGGGGGGGGNRSVDPPRKAELVGKDKLTVPAVKPPAMEMKKDETPPPAQNLNIPAETLASANLALPGSLEGALPSSESLGSGTGGGSGTGSGSGIGSGSGSGLGPGWGGGTGGGAYRPGNGVETPKLLREVKPQYTAQAMRAKIQGTVLLECVVQPDGSVGNIKVVRSLDGSFGLDQEAIKAARQWQFAPGTRFGQAVAVLVTIEIAFTLR
jgi:periplasmic protein TonB